ncbi:endonuclease III [Alicyclobacillus ferrooxydans]|uniref:Endonuclease III n=1 Tax=Alicyclobacillus ferrooxydans TaxID=471514 RepID=A0A0P9F274_9BACL|nr:endonuclease III [Alicyclobacillus ferrooxydans]KPV45466.1 endonuclease III [Alicyclobacillus ferrooxydans]
MNLLSRAQTRRMLGKLEEAYPDAKCALNYTTPFELLIATMLSAQCTDARVNMVTANLFQKYRTPEDYAQLTPEILQEDIAQLGLFRAKSENIIAASRLLLEKFGGEVPKTQEELVQLPGVGRKTANVVLSNAFGIPALAVDTHVQRVANRIGIANSMNPEITERQVCQRVPQKLWSQAHHWLIFHGRQVCSARNPKCEQCPVSEFCQFYQKLQQESKLREKVFEDKPGKKASKGRRSSR